MRTSTKPGQIWLDTDGKRIHARGGSLLEVDETIDVAVGPAPVDFFLGFDSDDRRLTGSLDVVGEPRVLASAERSFLSRAVAAHA